MDHAFVLTKKYGRIALAWASAPLDLTALKNAHEQRRAFPISIRLVVAAHPAAIVRAGAAGCVCRGITPARSHSPVKARHIILWRQSGSNQITHWLHAPARPFFPPTATGYGASRLPCYNPASPLCSAAHVSEFQSPLHQSPSHSQVASQLQPPVIFFIACGAKREILDKNRGAKRHEERRVRLETGAFSIAIT